MFELINPFNRTFQKAYAIFCLLGTLVASLFLLAKKPMVNKLALLLCYVQVVAMFIGFILGRIAIYTGDKRDFNRFALVVLFSLIPMIILEFMPMTLIEESPEYQKEVKEFANSPIALIFSITFKALIYGFQLALSICAFIHASRLTYPPANPEAPKNQQYPEASYPQQNPWAPDSQQNV